MIALTSSPIRDVQLTELTRDKTTGSGATCFMLASLICSANALDSCKTPFSLDFPLLSRFGRAPGIYEYMAALSHRRAYPRVPRLAEGTKSLNVLILTLLDKRAFGVGNVPMAHRRTTSTTQTITKSRNAKCPAISWRER